MKRLFFLAVFLVTIMSCESEEQKIEKAINVVNTFISNVSFDNYDKMYELYPNFRNVSEYWKVSKLTVDNTSISEEGVVTIIGKAGNKNLLFELQRNNSNYEIISSKGLSSDYNSNIYKYCKNIGCIGSSTTDADISIICKSNREDYQNLIEKIKEDIENKIILENHTVTNSYGFVSGDVTVKNYSRFTLPGGAYNLYINYRNKKGDILFTSKQILTYDAIPFNQSKTVHVFEPNSKSFRKISIELNIISTNFIEDIIAQYSTGIGCIYSNNL